MDLVAARGTSQLATISSHQFCTVCDCRRLKNLGKYDHEAWSIRDVNKMHQGAKEWRDASTVKDQERIWLKHGTRWSELWRLPYWDPTRQLVVDAMHCILEGLAHTHFRVTLGLTSAVAATQPQAIQAFSHPFTKVDPESHPLPENMTRREAGQVSAIHVLLTSPLAGLDTDGHVNDKLAFDASITLLSKRLDSKNKTSLIFVAHNFDSLPVPKPEVRGPKHVNFTKKDWITPHQLGT